MNPPLYVSSVQSGLDISANFATTATTAVVSHSCGGSTIPIVNAGDSVGKKKGIGCARVTSTSQGFAHARYGAGIYSC
jgi:hypothetical protein